LIVHGKASEEALQEGGCGGCRPAYPALAIFKILPMQRWLSLSDARMSGSRRDRLSFLRFSGLLLHSPTPDASTICRFRQALAHKDLYRRLLGGINRQVSGHGVIIKTGMAVDASLVASSRRPQKVIEISSAAEEETSIPEGSGAKVSYSGEVSAAWTARELQPHYGYKVRKGTDACAGGHVPPAHVSDSVELET
jgi:IS5 family transposase